MPVGVPFARAVTRESTEGPPVVPLLTEPLGRPITPPTEAKVCFPRRTFSALMCNYNHAKYVEQAMNAVLNQSRPPDEYLILDDASTDNSVEIIQSYAARYPCIKLVARKKNGGFASGINEIAALATGDYIHIGAADDYMMPGFIERAMRLAEEFPHAGIVSGELIHLWEESGNTMLIEIPGWGTGYVSPEKYLHEYLEVGDPTCTLSATTLFRRDLFHQVGGMRTELGIWDVSFVLQASALMCGMCYLDAPVYTWVCRPQGLTRLQNSDLVRSAETYLNYVRRMRSPPYRNLFSEKFAHQWLLANMQQSARTFACAFLNQMAAAQESETRVA